MSSRSADRELKLPAVSMSLEQFRAIIGDLRSHFSDEVVTTTIKVRNGIETLTYSNVEEFTAADPALPDVVSALQVNVFDGEHSYAASRSAELVFQDGDSISPNRAKVVGTEKGFVLGLSQAIAESCRRRATWYSVVGLRGLLWVLAAVMFIGFFVALGITFAVPQLSKVHYASVWGLLSYLMSLILLVVFVGFDRFYYAVFPSTVIVARPGPRRWPYEFLMLILAIGGLILAMLAFTRP